MFEENPFPHRPYRSEFVARSISSALWLCVLNFILSVLYSFASCILHPSILFADWIIISPHFLSLLLQLNLFSCLFIVLFSCCYSLKFNLFPTRYQKLSSLLNKQSITFLLIHTTLSWAHVVTWRRHDYSHGERTEELVYLFYGFLFGLSTAISTLSSQSNTLSFPIIQQPKLFRIQLEILSFSKRDLLHSIFRIWLLSSFALLFLTSLSPDWITSQSLLSTTLIIFNPIFLLKLNFILSLSLVQSSLCWKIFNISQTHGSCRPVPVCAQGEETRPPLL